MLYENETDYEYTVLSLVCYDVYIYMYMKTCVQTYIQLVNLFSLSCFMRNMLWIT